MDKIIIAIDGYSGTGKSSTAREVAKRLGYLYVDSGAMYRATTLFFIQKEVNIHDKQSVHFTLESMRLSFEKGSICLNGDNVEHQIRSMQVNQSVSEVSALPEVREALVRQQRVIGQDKGIVMDGRDIGTVVFPEAELKIFMVASPEIRAHRRQKELLAAGHFAELNEIKENLIERDRFDSARKVSPLRKDSSAIELDTSDLAFDDQVSNIVELAKKRIHEN